MPKNAAIENSSIFIFSPILLNPFENFSVIKLIKGYAPPKNIAIFPTTLKASSIGKILPIGSTPIIDKNPRIKSPNILTNCIILPNFINILTVLFLNLFIQKASIIANIINGKILNNSNLKFIPKNIPATIGAIGNVITPYNNPVVKSSRCFSSIIPKANGIEKLIVAPKVEAIITPEIQYISILEARLSAIPSAPISIAKNIDGNIDESIPKRFPIGVNKNPITSPTSGESEYIPTIDIAIDPMESIPSLNFSPRPILLLFM